MDLQKANKQERPVNMWWRNILKPVWLLFILPLSGRLWFMLHKEDMLIKGANILFLAMLIVLTWWLAAALATSARMSPHGKERFMVMSTLGIIMPLLSGISIELAQSPLFLVFQILFLGFMFLIFSLSRRWPYSENIYRLIYSACIVVFILLISFLPVFLWLIQPQLEELPVRDSASMVVVGISLIGLMVAIGSCLFSSRWVHLIPMRLRKLTGLALLCGFSSLVGSGVVLMTQNAVQYIYIALATVQPFFIAALFCMPYLFTQYKQERLQQEMSETPVKKSTFFHGLTLLLIVLYFACQLYLYVTTPQQVVTYRASHVVRQETGLSSGRKSVGWERVPLNPPYAFDREASQGGHGE